MKESNASKLLDTIKMIWKIELQPVKAPNPSSKLLNDSKNAKNMQEDQILKNLNVSNQIMNQTSNESSHQNESVVGNFG